MGFLLCVFGVFRQGKVVYLHFLSDLGRCLSFLMFPFSGALATSFDLPTSNTMFVQDVSVVFSISALLLGCHLLIAFLVLIVSVALWIGFLFLFQFCPFPLVFDPPSVVF